MREFMTIIESLTEMDKGGELDSEFSRDETKVDPHYDPETTEMFPELPKDLKKIGDMGEFTVAMAHGANRAEFEVFVMLDNKKVAYCEAKRHWGGGANSDYPYQIKAVEVAPEYRGRGLAMELYAFLLKNVVTEIVADQMQTHDGAKLWEKMLRSGRFFIYWANTRLDIDHPQHEGQIKRVRDLEKVYKHDDYVLFCELKDGGDGNPSSYEYQKPVELPHQ